MNMLDDQDHFRETFGNVSFEWTIRNFYRKIKDGSTIQSPKFFLSDAHFSIRVYPVHDNNSSSVCGARWISLYLQLENSQVEHRVEYTIGVKDYNGLVLASRECNHVFTPGGQGKYWDRLIEISEATSGIANNYYGRFLIVFWEGRLVGSERQSILGTLSKDFEKFFMSGCQADTVINVKGKTFPVHRSILSARSSVFQAMFETEMKEKETGNISITDCEAQSFGAFLLFLYSGNIKYVTSDNALEIYAMADKYNVQDLKETCCESLSRSLSVDSVCDVLRLTELHQEQELLKSAAVEFFLQNASEILRTEKWRSLSGENPTLASELFIELADEHAYKNTTNLPIKSYCFQNKRVKIIACPN